MNLYELLEKMEKERIGMVQYTINNIIRKTESYAEQIIRLQHY